MASFDANEARLSGFQTDPEPKWITKDLPPINQERYLHAAVKLDHHRMLVMGGYDGDNSLSCTEIYDHQKREWLEGPELNEKREGHAAALCNGRVYVFGGWNNDGKQLDSIECLDLAQKPLQWETMNVTLSTKRNGCAAAVVESDIYVMGGYNGSSHLKSVDILDTTMGTIKKGPSMTTAQCTCAAGVIDNAIYLVGGMDDKGYVQDKIEFLSVDSRTKGLGKWQVLKAAMSTARSFPAVVVVHHCLVIMGGDGKDGEYLSSVDVFDTRRSVCWRLPDMKLKRAACAAVTLSESNVIVVGGLINDKYYDGGNDDDNDDDDDDDPAPSSMESLQLVKEEEKKHQEMEGEIKSLKTTALEKEAKIKTLTKRLAQSQLKRNEDLEAFEQKCKDELEAAAEKHDAKLWALACKHSEKIKTLKSTVQELSERLSQSELTHKEELDALDRQCKDKAETLKRKYDEQVEALRHQHKQESETTAREHKQELEAMEHMVQNELETMECKHTKELEAFELNRKRDSDTMMAKCETMIAKCDTMMAELKKQKTEKDTEHHRSCTIS